MKRFLVFLCIAFLFGIASQASALTIDGAGYLGHVYKATPDSPTDEAGYINHLLGMNLGDTENYGGNDYYRSMLDATGFPTATAAGNKKADYPAYTFDATGFTYILAKYGVGQVTGGSYIWYLGTNGGIETLPTLDIGLSHVTAFNYTSVPEPSTMFLLGFGLVGLVGVTRKVKK